MATVTATIAHDLRDACTSRLRALAKRASKLGVDAFSWEFTNERVDTIEVWIDAGRDSRSVKRTVRLVDVTITGELPRLNGWRVVAAVDPSENGNIVRGVEEVPERFRHTGTTCEHCRKVRNRTALLVLAHEDGRYIQVGKSCVRDFTGHTNPALAFSSATFFEKLAGELGDEFGGKRGPEVISLDSYLACVSDHIDAYGWVGRGNQCLEMGRVATADAVWLAMADKDSPKRDASDKGRSRADAAITWAANLAGGNDYERNLSVIARDGFVLAKHSGLAASLLVAFDRTLAARQEMAASEYVGTVGERREFTADPVRSIPIDTMYGVSTIWIFRTEAGEVLKWKASGSPDFPGGRVVITGTVKAHEEYKGTRQTVVTRCKIRTAA